MKDYAKQAYVHLNPEAANQKSEQLNKINAVIMKLHKDMRDIPHFASRAYANNKAGYKAEYARLKAEMEQAQAQYAEWKAVEDLFYCDPEKALEVLILDVENIETGLKEAKAKFVEYFNTNPAYAIEWKSDEVVRAQAAEESKAGLLSVLGQTKTVAAFRQALEEWERETSKEIISGARRVSRSSNAYSNINDQYKLAGTAEFLERLLWEVKSDLSRFERDVEATAAVREAAGWKPSAAQEEEK